MEDPVFPLERNLYGHPLAGLLGERQFEKVLLEHGCEKVFNSECLFVNRARGLFLSMCVDDVKLAGKTENIEPTLKIFMKCVDLGEPTSFLDHVHVGCTQRECKIRDEFVDSTEICSNPGFLLEPRKNYLSELQGNLMQKQSWSYDMEGHAKKCVERCCELANKTTQQIFQSRNAMHG